MDKHQIRVWFVSLYPETMKSETLGDKAFCLLHPSKARNPMMRSAVKAMMVLLNLFIMF